MRIGIVGAENSHSVHIARTLNVEKAVPGCEVTHIWGETAEFAAKAAADGSIPNTVADPAEMIGQVDAVVVDHRDGKDHLPAARPLVEAGLPAFIDKPFCTDLNEGVEFVRLARSRGVAITSFSTLTISRAARDFAASVKEVGKLRTIVTAGPCDIDSQWSGVFFYGIHQVEYMLGIVNSRPLSVTATRRGDDGIAVISFDSGVTGVVTCLKDWWGGGGFIATAYGDEGVRHSALASEEKPFLAGVQRFCTMFRTGKEPAPPSSYLAPIAVLTAMQESFGSGKPVEVAAVPEL